MLGVRWRASSAGMLSAALVTLALGLLIWASTHSASYEYCQAERHSGQADKHDFHKEIAYFFVCEGVTIDVNGDLMTALGTLAIAAFTLTLWLTSREQGRLTEIAIRDARVASQRELRAYVSAVPDKAFINDGHFCVIVKVENRGNTPAFETRCLWALTVGSPPGAENTEFKFTNPDNDPIPTFVLYPGDSNSSVRPYKLSEADLANIIAGSAVFRAYGVVEYRDAFNEAQVGTFNCFLDGDGYKLWLHNYRLQPDREMRPVKAPFQFAQGGNRASFQ